MNDGSTVYSQLLADLPWMTFDRIVGRYGWDHNMRTAPVVELFFKWIKQHLRIKRFYGLSENAVKCQIWIAVSV